MYVYLYISSSHCTSHFDRNLGFEINRRMARNPCLRGTHDREMHAAHITYCMTKRT